MSHPHPARDCILCGRCLDVCPVFLASGKEELSPKAKHQLMAALRSNPQLLEALPARLLADKCVSCGRCEKACPQGLSVPAALGALRAEHAGWPQWLWQRWINGGNILWPAMATLGRMAPRLPAPAAARPLMEKLAAMHDTPPQPWFRMAAPAAGTQPPLRPVMLFSGCTARRIRPRWSSKATALLELAGIRPQPETAFTCCGATLEHAGLPDAARQARHANITAWHNADRPLLVTFCATCAHGLHGYARHEELWHETPPDSAALWTQSVVPLSVFLQKFPVQELDTAPEWFRYHQPCHAPAQHDPDAALLYAMAAQTPAAAAHGRRIRPAGMTTRQCCGMGGVMQLAAPSLCGMVNAACWQALDSLCPAQDNACPPPVVTGCSGCTLQLSGTAPEHVAVHHWLDVLTV
ncbi:(Fe-S)-binding protein [Oleidesulfovibrio alaskensis]|uniref:(Fe-S)-binding protein n=1 Tax=Oleidesulfovibrio alaskensis TaxID=58180 RepID=UPI001A5B92DA|nr:(Fe-S)-binding protein [Oleidesulfovibrio alaskensis]MBL3582487.1 (Fe-S)-binding protein [Oleidesulfovibrio alaskensis]